VVEGQPLGTVVYRADGVVIGRRALVADRGFATAGWTTKAGYTVHEVKSWFGRALRSIGAGLSDLF
jgi:hypothetical protein